MRRAVVAGSIAALFLSRWAFARPRPSPLDPMVRAMQQQQVAAARAAAAAAAEAEQPKRERLLHQPSEEARQAFLEARGRK